MVILFNFSLILAFLLGSFVVWRLSRAKSYDEERVLDLVIFGVIVGLVAGKLGVIRDVGEIGVRGVMEKMVWGKAGGFQAEAGVLVFLVFAVVLLRCRYRWPIFPILDFLAVGALAARVVVVLGMILGGIGEVGGLGGRGVELLFGLNMLALVEVVRRYYYRPGRLLEVFLIATLKPLLMLTAGLVWVMLEGAGLTRQFTLGLRVGYRKNMSSQEDQNQTEKTLQTEAERLEHQLHHIEREDPKNRPDRQRENALEEESDEVYEGNRAAALRKALMDRLGSVKTALGKLRRGSYSICDRCGEKIDPARLQAVPGATYCVKCEAEVEAKKAATS